MRMMEANSDIHQAQTWVSSGLKSDQAPFLPNGNRNNDTFRMIVPGGGIIGIRDKEFTRLIVTRDGIVTNAFPVKEQRKPWKCHMGP